MKPLILSFFSLLFTTGLLAQATEGTGENPAAGVTVTVTLENVLSDTGEILGGLHKEQTFMRGPGAHNYKGAATQGAQTLVFENVTPGTYAFLVLHDVNANGRMDFEASGMPTEPYAMSGESMQMGPPSFQASAFEVGTEDLHLSIRF